MKKKAKKQSIVVSMRTIRRSQAEGKGTVEQAPCGAQSSKWVNLARMARAGFRAFFEGFIPRSKSKSGSKSKSILFAGREVDPQITLARQSRNQKEFLRGGAKLAERFTSVKKPLRSPRLCVK